VHGEDVALHTGVVLASRATPRITDDLQLSSSTSGGDVAVGGATHETLAMDAAATGVEAVPNVSAPAAMATTPAKEKQIGTSREATQTLRPKVIAPAAGHRTPIRHAA